MQGLLKDNKMDNADLDEIVIAIEAEDNTGQRQTPVEKEKARKAIRKAIDSGLHTKEDLQEYIVRKNREMIRENPQY